MLKLSLSHRRRGGRPWAAVLATAIACVSRLFAGPVPANWLKPGIERAFAAQVQGGRASLDQVWLGWFPQERAFGFRLDGLRLDDDGDAPWPGRAGWRRRWRSTRCPDLS